MTDSTMSKERGMKQKIDMHQYGENGYPRCSSCDDEIIWGELCVYWSWDFFHPKCWDKFCKEYYQN